MQTNNVLVSHGGRHVYIFKNLQIIIIITMSNYASSLLLSRSIYFIQTVHNFLVSTDIIPLAMFKRVSLFWNLKTKQLNTR
jgi:hypothetical protein